MNYYFPKSIKILLFVIMLLLSFGVFRYAFSSYALLKYPFEYAEGEGHSLTRAKLLSEGESIYVKNDRYPIISNPYPPLYTWLQTLLIKIFGLSFFGGRLISLIASLITGYLIFKIIKEKTRNFYSAILGVGFFYISEYIIIGMNFAEANSLCLALGLTAVYLVSKYKQDRLNLLLGSIFLIGAIYTKQPAIFIWFALAIWLFIQDWRLAIKYNLIVGLIIFIIFLIMQYKTKGLFFYNIFISLQSLRYNFYSSIALLGFYFLNSIILLIIIGVGSFKRGRRRLSYLSIWDITFVFIFLQTLLISSQAGRWFTYLMPLYAWTCILLGFSLAEKISNKSARLNITFMLLILQIILTILSNIFINLTRYKPEALELKSLLLCTGPTRRSLDNGLKISNYIKNTPGDIIAFQSESFLALNNKKIFFTGEGSEFSVFDRLSNKGMINPEFIIRDIKGKIFSLILVDAVILPQYRQKDNLLGIADFIIGRKPLKGNELNYALTESVARIIFENYKLVDKIEIIKRGHWVTCAIFEPKN